MKKTPLGYSLRALLIVIATALTLGIVWLVNAIWFKPFSINTFFNRAMIEVALDSPEMLSSLRILESVGLHFHNDDLDDASPQSTLAMLDKAAGFRETLTRYDDASLNESEKLSKQIAMYMLDTLEQGRPYAFHNYPVNQLFGVQSGFPSFMDSTHQVNDLASAEDYIVRLEKSSTKFDQVLAGLAYREERDILPPTFVVDRVLKEMSEFVAQKPRENILYASFEKKLADVNLPAEQKNQVLADAEKAIQEAVYPAYERLINYFQAVRSKTTNRHGIWALPGGDEYYRVALRFFTTTDYTPDEIHQLGLAEVARIQNEILTILASEGINAQGGFFAAINELAAREQFYYSDDEAGREQILTDYQRIIDEINTGMANAFHTLPKADVAVKRIPLFKEPTAPGAYYNRPALDGSRPGIFYANLHDIKATPKYSMRTLAYHEAVPGHHFQISSSMELEGIPFFRKMSPFTAFTEGWALYAEQLAWELGYQQNPFDNVGRLQAELFRAVRLVVDTGIHRKRWTREEAIDYMLKNTGMAKSDVVAEVERYIVMPGQACSYKIGMMKILALREKAKQALGKRFNLKDFHTVVLDNGAVPLAILEALIDDYIADAQAGRTVMAVR